MSEYLLKINENISGPIDFLHAKGTTISTAPGLTFDEDNTLHVQRLEADTIITKSDVQFKENVSDLTNCLDKIIQFKSKSYNYIHDESKLKHNGFIAQEVQTIVPDVVLKDMYGNLFINYIELIPLITDSISELNNKINALDSKLNSVSKDIAKS
tara:strand:- start:1252 stop:1716 length:465 start_codon:yes stop_codon:yes gene_type:complete